jgi:hypothetical protein
MRFSAFFLIDIVVYSSNHKLNEHLLVNSSIKENRYCFNDSCSVWIQKEISMYLVA